MDNMFEQLALKQLIKELKQIFEGLPDLRKGKNNRYEMVDAGLGAFSVFFTQCASFLEHQEEMKRSKGRSNAESLFEMVNIPSDNQIRGLLDPVKPKPIAPMYRIIYQRLEQTGILDQFRSYSNSLLIALDGTEYFSSQKIDCPQCSQRELANGKTNYFHRALTPVIVQAGNENVISLEPEFITPQDGHEKQDCEIAAGKRWINTHGKYY
jgi:hypothetical protein